MTYSAAFSQAIEIMVFITTKSEEEKLQYLTTQEISKYLNIPMPSVKRLIGLLKREGLVSSKSGMAGGLAARKKNNEVTLYDIFVAVEGNDSLFKIHTNFDISIMKNKRQVEIWLEKGSKALIEAERAFVDSLKNTTLEELLRLD